jgi:hypothetical protein
MTEVIDARDPHTVQYQALEARVASKEKQKLLFLLNRIGACTRPEYLSGVLDIVVDRSIIDTCPRQPNDCHIRKYLP